MPKYREWIEDINTLTKTANITIAPHGLLHHQSNMLYAKSQEFLGKTTGELSDVFAMMESIFKKSKIKFSLGFRAPGWGVDTKVLDQLIKRNYLYSASSSDFYSSINTNTSKKAGLQNQNLIGPTFIKNRLINFTANCFAHQYSRAVEIAKHEGIIMVHAHIASTVFGLKYVDKYFCANIQKMIKEIETQTLKRIWHASLDEIAKFTYAKQKLKYTVKNNIAELTNTSDYRLKGLTITHQNRTTIIKTIPPYSSVTVDLNEGKSKEKKVSIILTVYNGSTTVVDSLQSLAKQDYPNYEIIVVNDGSTDNSKELIKRYIKKTNDTRIILVNQKNLGRAKAKNAGFLKSTGEVITFCEDDAIYDRSYISYGVSHFKPTDKMLGGVIGPHYVWNKNESINTRVKDIERRRNFFKYKPSSCWFYKRDVFEKIGMYDESFEFGEDIVPAVLLAKKGYHFVYEENARWLHKEPANYISYLKRKFKGGVGMALLVKKNILKELVSVNYILPSFLLLLNILLLIIIQPYLIMLLPFAGIVLLILARTQAIKKARALTDEPLSFIIFSVLWEYTWWAATLCGYILGLCLPTKKINSYLKGR